jgi:FkbM family methyltransferase
LNINNVVIYDEGLSNKKDKAYFEWISNNNPGGSGLSNNPMERPAYEPINNNKYTVNLITIDLLNLDKLDFIKLDVEGYEIKIIEGAINTIRKYKPIITLEIYEDFTSKKFSSIENANIVFKILLDEGYTITCIKDADFLCLPNKKI